MGNRLNDLILQIYECATEAQLWPEVMDQLKDHFRARGCILFEWEDSLGSRVLHAPILTTNYKREALEQYMRDYGHLEEEDQNIYEQQSLSSNTIELVSESILYNSKKEYFQRPHVKQLAAYGIHYRLGGMLDKDNPHRSRFSLQLSESRGHLSDSEQRELSKILPHIAKSLGIGQQFAVQARNQQTLLSALDALDIGICLLSNRGEIITSNKEFERQNEAYSSFRKERNGRLSFRSSDAQKKLTALLETVENHGHFGARPRKEAVVVGDDSMQADLCIELIPLHRSSDIGTAVFDGALLISRDTRKPIESNVDLVKKVYDFTDAESNVVELIAQGLKNSEIALRRDVSIETVNSQVKSVLSKSRSENRTQLVRMLCSF